jgi:hypothetical protein
MSCWSVWSCTLVKPFLEVAQRLPQRDWPRPSTEQLGRWSVEWSATVLHALNWYNSAAARSSRAGAAPRCKCVLTSALQRLP